jgi:D-tyrosyl-tRNA(Tyr) deacylase
MRLVIQRVTSSSVSVDGTVVGAIERGLVVLTGFHKNDHAVDLQAVANKLVTMRLFANASGKFDLSVQDVAGGILLIPQFTLFADTRKGRRPDFFAAMEPRQAKEKFERFIAVVNELHTPVASGIFGSDMQVALVNDGPVTITYDSPETQNLTA